MKNDKALVILSGGADSTICLSWAKQNFKEVHAITYFYGQRHSIELESARKVAELAGVISHEFLDVEEAIKDTSAMSNTDVELTGYNNINEVGVVAGAQTTFVPGRNILFLTIGANRAWKIGARYLITGICAEESGGYPDVSSVFAQSMQTALTSGMGESFYIETPLMHLSKAESVDLALKLPGCFEALSYTTTAYDGSYPPKTTGDRDHATVLREKGFMESGLPDPLYIRAKIEHPDFVLPNTDNYKTAKELLSMNKSLKEICEYFEY